jgi:hypothetical protein
MRPDIIDKLTTQVSNGTPVALAMAGGALVSSGVQALYSKLYAVETNESAVSYWEAQAAAESQRQPLVAVLASVRLTSLTPTATMVASGCRQWLPVANGCRCGRRLAAVSGLCTSLCAGRAAFSTELPWCIGGVQRGIGVRERVGCVGRRLKHA